MCESQSKPAPQPPAAASWPQKPEDVLAWLGEAQELALVLARHYEKTSEPLSTLCFRLALDAAAIEGIMQSAYLRHVLKEMKLVEAIPAEMRALLSLEDKPEKTA